MLRRSSAVAVVATVVGGWLGQAPALAAQPGHDTAGRAATQGTVGTEHTGNAPSVWPKPQSLTVQGDFARVTDEVTLVADADADPSALEVVQDALRAAGARSIVRARNAGPGLTVYAGSAAQGPLRTLRAPDTGDMPDGGYRLAVSGRTVALDGTGADGLFHAAQTLRQLATTQHGDRGFSPVVVRDWPAAPVRGTAESFYGVPWTQAQRLAQLDFMARTKQNRYLYAPGDDPYRQAQWREPYPARQRAEFRELTARAAHDHVTVAWAVAPGQAMCFSSPDDQRALERKLDAMWALGVRAFQLQFQDVSYSEWHCGRDAARFGSGPDAAARAQAQVANAVADHLRATYGAAAPELSLLPTEFYQDGTTPYRTALAGALAGGIDVAWTGVGVLPRQITGEQVAGAKAALRHPLLTVDNYPVNDFAPERLFLGPYTGREPAVATVSDGVLASAMQQPAASRIPLFTAADFAWNPDAYDPQASWQAAIDDLAGPDPKARAALGALAGNEQSSALNGGDAQAAGGSGSSNGGGSTSSSGSTGTAGRTRSTDGTAGGSGTGSQDGAESAYLQPLVRQFWTALDAAPADPAALRTAAQSLRSAFTVMRTAPASLAPLAGGTFGDEVRPWLDRLAQYGTAGEHAVDMLVAQAGGDGARAWQARRDLDTVRSSLTAQGTSAQVGGGTLDAFLDRAVDDGDGWLGLRADGRTGTTTMASGRGTDPSAMVDGKESTAWSSSAPPQPDDSFGVDLGSARPVSSVRITMGDGSGSDDFLHDAVLEVAGDDGTGWRKIGAYHDRSVITATLPAGTRAREVRLRATAAQDGPVTVREFAVTVSGSAALTADGGPNARAAVDGDLTSAADAGPLTVRFAGARLLDTVTVAAQPGVPRQRPASDDRFPAGPPDAAVPPAEVSDGRPTPPPPVSVEVHVPGPGGGEWRRIGDLASDGWTELPAGVMADAVRLSDAAGVREVVPWFAEAPRVTTGGTDVDASAGGPAVTVTATVTPRLPRDLEAAVTPGKAPVGITVTAPAPRVLRRGASAAVPLRIAVAPGTAPGSYTVPVRFTVGGRTVERQVTVRAHAPTGGPDLLRSGTAFSSGDETPDFPAGAVTDGDPTTRWSSPAEDDAWVEVRLAAPARIGRVVLDWQDAYAASYEIQTSADGVTWQTAAVVADGDGGREEVWLDGSASGTRFLRMQGVKRATKYGYSLYGMQAYAVTG